MSKIRTKMFGFRMLKKLGRFYFYGSFNYLFLKIQVGLAFCPKFGRIQSLKSKRSKLIKDSVQKPDCLNWDTFQSAKIRATRISALHCTGMIFWPMTVSLKFGIVANVIGRLQVVFYLLDRSRKLYLELSLNYWFILICRLDG